ncbi:MAG: glycosyltransferase family 2 protein [Lachnospiraceae bacterium]|nr:glycosyltransferase family 2 protein [Lachnospiraceae bacterium]
MNSLVSVIVPVYNSSSYLNRCVDSLLAQTYTNVEIILVDDGSKDNSYEMCCAYAENDKRVKAFHKENGGSSSARNLGIDNASGDYVAFCDSDDYVERDMYEVLVRVAEENPDGDIFQLRAIYHSGDGEALENPTQTDKTEFISSEENFRLLMLHLGDASFCTKLIRHEFMKDFRFSEGKLNEDFELILAMIQKTKGVYSVDHVGYHIVLSDNSNTRGNYKKEFYDAIIKNSDVAYEVAEKKYPSVLTEARRFQFFQRLDYMLHIPVSKMSGNEVCREVVRFLKQHRAEIKSNPYLSEKEKRNLLILGRSPRISKTLHGALMKFKKPGKTVVYEGAVLPKEEEGKKENI